MPAQGTRAGEKDQEKDHSGKRASASALHHDCWTFWRERVTLLLLMRHMGVFGDSEDSAGELEIEKRPESCSQALREEREREQGEGEVCAVRVPRRRGSCDALSLLPTLARRSNPPSSRFSGPFSDVSCVSLSSFSLSVYLTHRSYGKRGLWGESEWCSCCNSSAPQCTSKGVHTHRHE